MFGFDWLKRRPTARRTALRRPTLCAERLEDRLVPSAFTNGDFEGGSFTPISLFTGQPIAQDSVPNGWTLGPPNDGNVNPPDGLSHITVTNVVDPTLHLQAADGSGNYVRFQSTETNFTKDCLLQDFDTVAGQQYRVTFSVAITNAGVGQSNVVGLDPVWDENTPNQQTMGANNFYIAPTSSQGPTGYQTFSFIETASTARTRIDFHGVDNAGSILLDDVSVVPVVPVPPSGQPPSISAPASGTVSASGTTAALSVAASDPQGQALTYT